MTVSIRPFAMIALLEHVMNGPEDVRGPRVLHPSFYGS